MVYYQLSGENSQDQGLMVPIDQLHMRDPSADSRRMCSYLTRRTGWKIDRKRVIRLMKLMGIEVIYPRKRTTIPGGPSGVHPYRLKDFEIDRPGQVLCADITFIPMRRG